MTVLGRLLHNRRAGETHAAWNLPNLHGPDLILLTSQSFTDGGAMPPVHSGRSAGGDNLSPQLAWSTLPLGTAQLLLVVEDIDVPMPKPIVHCVALIDPTSSDHLGPGALTAGRPASGVSLLRSTSGRGYLGPAPIKGHGPHHYTFQLFALKNPVGDDFGATPPDRARPRVLLPAITAEVLGRGRLTGVFER